MLKLFKDKEKKPKKITPSLNRPPRSIAKDLQNNQTKIRNLTPEELAYFNLLGKKDPRLAAEIIRELSWEQINIFKKQVAEMPNIRKPLIDAMEWVLTGEAMKHPYNTRNKSENLDKDNNTPINRVFEKVKNIPSNHRKKRGLPDNLNF